MKERSLFGTVQAESLAIAYFVQSIEYNSSCKSQVEKNKNKIEIFEWYYSKTVIWERKIRKVTLKKIFTVERAV